MPLWALPFAPPPARGGAGGEAGASAATAPHTAGRRGAWTASPALGEVRGQGALRPRFHLLSGKILAWNPLPKTRFSRLLKAWAQGVKGGTSDGAEPPPAPPGPGRIR